jgi:hypothetical protein
MKTGERDWKALRVSAKWCMAGSNLFGTIAATLMAGDAFSEVSAQGC